MVGTGSELGCSAATVEMVTWWELVLAVMLSNSCGEATWSELASASQDNANLQGLWPAL